MLSADCKGRLYNWKFTSAVAELTDAATEAERGLVEALAACFGNVGHFEGDLGVVVAHAVASLGVEDD
jgi:hypothetical protein